MNPSRLLLVPLIPALALTLSGATATAQFRWVHVNHTKAANIIITPVDLNNGSKADLTRLPGISEGDAQKIIDGRPYQIRDELVRKKILSAEAYERIKGRVIAAER